jgi:hypothetical protein
VSRPSSRQIAAALRQSIGCTSRFNFSPHDIEGRHVTRFQAQLRFSQEALDQFQVLVVIFESSSVEQDAVVSRFDPQGDALPGRF